MKTNTNSERFQYVVLLLILYLSPIFADSKLSVYKKKCTGNTEMFDINYASISCYGGCTFGSEGSFSATFTIGDELLTTSPFVTARIFNIEAYNDTIDICNDGQLSNDNGYYCPSVGKYSIHNPTTLPGSKDSLYSKYWPWLAFSAYATFDFGDAEVECQFKVEGRYTNASQSIVSGSIILLLGIFSVRVRKRRLVDKAQQESRTSSSYFVEMGDE
jgi:hypothetical protein